MLNVALPNIDKIRGAANVFSFNKFRDILFSQDFSYLKTKTRNLFEINKSEYYVSEIIKSIYNVILVNYRNEYVYKNEIVNQLLIKKHSLNSTTLIDELRVNKSIADIVIINGESSVYEIKTEFDSPQRLMNQLTDYFMVFDKLYLVLSEKDINKYIFLLPEEVGIIIMNNEGVLGEYREAKLNPSRYNHEVILKTFRKTEYSFIINKHYGYLPDVPNTLYFKECKKLFSLIPIENLMEDVRLQWKKRKIKEIECFNDALLPNELKYMCWHLNLSKKDYSSLSEILQTKIGL